MLGVLNANCGHPSEMVPEIPRDEGNWVGKYREEEAGASPVGVREMSQFA